MSFSLRLFSSAEKVTNKLSEHKVFVIDIMFTSIFALFLRIYNLENWPRWYVDEGALGMVANNIGRGLWGYNTWGPNFFPPLLPPLVTLMLLTLGENFYSIRLPGAIAGSVSSILLYIIGKRLYNRYVGITAALILAVVSVHINRIALKQNFVGLFLLLTLLAYLKFQVKAEQRWIYLMGILAGLAFLSRYEGVISLLFLLFMFFSDRKFKKVPGFILTFVLVALISPLIGLIVDWNSFVFDTMAPLKFFPQRNLDVRSLVDSILFTTYVDQLGNTSSPLSFIWSLIGAISMIWILILGDSNRKFIVTWFVFLLPAVILVGWWGYLAEVYPLYSLTTAILLYYVVRSSYKNLFRFDPQIFRTSLKISRILVAAFLSTIIILATFLELTPVFNVDATWDQRVVVNWVNTNLKQGDMIAAAFPIVFMIRNGVGIPYQDVVLYTTHRPFCEYVDGLLLRYRVNVSLERIDYFIVDSAIYGFEPGRSIAETIKSQWIPIFKVGDYAIYKNPVTLLRKTLLMITDADSLNGAWGVEEEFGDISLNYYDKTQGNACVQAILISSPVGRAGIRLDPAGLWNLSKMDFLSFDIKYNTTDWWQYYIALRDSSSKLRFYEFYSSGTWQKVSVNLKQYSSEEIGFDLSSVNCILFCAYEPRKPTTPILINIDSVEAGTYEQS